MHLIAAISRHNFIKHHKLIEDADILTGAAKVHSSVSDGSGNMGRRRIPTTEDWSISAISAISDVAMVNRMCLTDLTAFLFAENS